MFSWEAANTNFIVIDLTWPGFKPTIYHTGGKHANHYNTDAIMNSIFQTTVENMYIQLR
jgi:hypothetical protein